MELAISDDKTKVLPAEGISEMLIKRRDIFQEIIVAALEEVGFGDAVAKGRKNDFVSEKNIFDIIKG